MGERLYHVSDRGGIGRFEPRVPPSMDAGVRDPVVWAIHERLLHNYLLPRDCPRVTFYAGPETSEADRARFLALGGAGHVVVIEKGWLERVRQARLWVYEMPEGAFSCALEGAGYFVARVAVQPKRVIEITDVLGALNARDVELRVVPSLWALRDAVAASTLAFSCIRMRHALPRGRGAEELILS